MLSRFFKKQKRVEFSVNGKPPKKTTGSLWSERSNQTELVLNLRQKAFDASQKAGFDAILHGSVKLTLTVYAPNILERKNRHDYLGDLDALVGGVFEALQPAPNTNPDLKVHSMLKNAKNVGSDIALIVGDDAQIASIVANKVFDTTEHYTVIVEAQ